MKKHLTSFVCIIALFLSPLSIKGQQFGFYSMYDKNWQVINPAALNPAFLQSDAENVLSASYRQQWVGVKGSPTSYNVNFEAVRIDSRSNTNPKYGMGLYGESAGALSANTIYFNYAYPLSFGNSYVATDKLYLGFNAGYLYQRINIGNLRFENGVDETIDNILKSQASLGTQSFFELTPGLFYTNGQSFYLGLSAPRLLTAGKLKEGFKILNQRPQFHLITGFYNDERTVQPSLWVRWQPGIEYVSLIPQSPLSATAHFKSQITEELTLGLGVSTSRWVHFEVAWQLGGDSRSMNASKPIFVSFNYDLPFYKSGLNLGQTVEINLLFYL